MSLQRSLLTGVERRHIVISAATTVDNKGSDAFPVAGGLRVMIKVEQPSSCCTVTVWRRQAGLLQYENKTDYIQMTQIISLYEYILQLSLIEFLCISY